MIRFGFEVEFACAAPRKRIVSAFRECGIELKRSSPRGNNGKNWQLGSDASVEPKDWANDFAFELSSPAFDAVTAHEALDATFSILDELNAETNSTTGLHVSMDLNDSKLMSELDELTLIILSNELDILTRYRRNRNTYCCSHTADIRRAVRSYKQLKHKHISVADYVRNRINLEEKFKTINFSKLEDKGYIEFRMMGGWDYHLRGKEIARDIERLEDSMFYAAYPEYKQRTVTRRLNQMLSAA